MLGFIPAAELHLSEVDAGAPERFCGQVFSPARRNGIHSARFVFVEGGQHRLHVAVSENRVGGEWAR